MCFFSKGLALKTFHLRAKWRGQCVDREPLLTSLQNTEALRVLEFISEAVERGLPQTIPSCLLTEMIVFRK